MFLASPFSSRSKDESASERKQRSNFSSVLSGDVKTCIITPSENVKGHASHQRVQRSERNMSWNCHEKVYNMPLAKCMKVPVYRHKLFHGIFLLRCDATLSPSFISSRDSRPSFLTRWQKEVPCVHIKPNKDEAKPMSALVRLDKRLAIEDISCSAIYRVLDWNQIYFFWWFFSGAIFLKLSHFLRADQIWNCAN